MKKLRLPYLIFYSLMLIAVCVRSQSANNDAIVTIIGNPIDNNNNDNNGNQFSNANLVNQTNEPPPPSQQQFAPTDQNIEPTLENGFHMRFQLESPASVERINSVNASSGSSSSSGSSGSSASGAKIKKRSVSIAERSFNLKKKIKTLMPKKKKKYHPTLCEKFK